MKLLRVRQASLAAGRRSGNGSRPPLPKPIPAAMVMRMAWEATVNVHDVDLAVGVWLGAHAYLRPGQLGRISWEWVNSGGSGNPDRAAVVLHPVEESEASKTGEYDETVIIDKAALLRALLQLRPQRPLRTRLFGVPEVFWQTLHRAIALLGVATALG